MRAGEAQRAADFLTWLDTTGYRQYAAHEASSGAWVVFVRSSITEALLDVLGGKGEIQQFLERNLRLFKDE